MDSDQVGTDAAEFIEIYDGGAGNTSLSGHVLVFYNGSNDLSYFAIDLTGSTNAQGYYTLGNTGVVGADQTFAGNLLQNGADAVALYVGSAASFPNNTPITTANLLDAVVYDTADADDAGLLVLHNAGQPQVDEDAGGAGTTNSIQRCPNGAGGARNTTTYSTFAPTPDAVNTCGVLAVPLWKKLLAMFEFQVIPDADARVDMPRHFLDSPLSLPSGGRELASKYSRDLYGRLIPKDISNHLQPIIPRGQNHPHSAGNLYVQVTLSQARLVIRNGQ